MAELTPADQFTQVNSPAYFKAAGAKIIAAKNAMIGADVVSDDGWYLTHLNNVDILWKEEGLNIRIKYGRSLSNEPLYDITIPTQWLA